MKHLLNRIPLLLALGLSGCLGLDVDPIRGLVLIRPSSGSGSGFVQTTSCHRTDWDGVYVTHVVSSNGVPLTGPGWLSCYPSGDPFDAAKTASYSSDTRELPEWIDFTGVIFEKGKHYSDAEYLARIRQPGVTERVYVRKQIPQSVVDEVREARRHQDPSKLPERSLHVYFIWTEEGIKLTWTVEHPGTWAPKIYGGYIPKDMDPKVAQALREAHSNFYELAP